MFDVRLVGAVRHPHDRGTDRGGMHGAPRHLVHRGGVVLVPACGAVVHRLVRQEPVARNEDVLDHEVVAAGCLQSDDVPDVVDAVIGTGDQEAAEIDRLAVLDHRPAHERPGGVVAARGPLPRAADQVATVDDDAGTHRRVRGRHAHGRVLAPDVLLGLLIEQCEVPVVHTDDRGDPAGGTACAREAAHGFVEQRRVALQTTPLLGLEQFEEADLVEFGHRLVGQPAQFLGGGRALGDTREEIGDTVENRLCVTLFNGRHWFASKGVRSNLEEIRTRYDLCRVAASCDTWTSAHAFL